MKLFISFMIIMISIILFFMNHPLSMGLLILTQTFFICMISGMLISTYWFSYILFLTFMGGLLVLFIYVSSIASNEMFKSSMKLKFIIMISPIVMLIMYMIFNFNLNWMNYFINLEMNNFFNYYLFFNNENKMSMTKLYNSQTNYLMMLMVSYLFITLIAIVKITNIFFGPLRPSN
uniref:NADH-ubiquinone oxidoreductase chain 6 n=1 Tax=Alucita montana TaxID=1498831 RepID=A0A076EBU7_9NEOP|nr:NADH dehydrogenase subunit 6 [Alucita montana]